MNKTFIFSPTGLQSYFEGICPAKWKFGKQYKQPASEPMQLGTDVHAAMEVPEKAISYTGDDKVMNLAARLYREMSAHGIKPLAQYNEFSELFPVAIIDGVEYKISRRIDAIAEKLDGSRVVVDYKVVMGSWKPLAYDSAVIPKAQNYQSIAYLQSAKENEKWWPKEVWYFTINAFSRRVAVHRYAPKPAQLAIDTEHMLKAAQLLRHANEQGLFPKVRGNHCTGDWPCPFASLCYAKNKSEYTQNEKKYEKIVKK